MPRDFQPEEMRGLRAGRDSGFDDAGGAVVGQDLLGDGGGEITAVGEPEDARFAAERGRRIGGEVAGNGGIVRG